MGRLPLSLPPDAPALQARRASPKPKRVLQECSDQFPMKKEGLAELPPFEDWQALLIAWIVGM